MQCYIAVFVSMYNPLRSSRRHAPLHPSGVMVAVTTKFGTIARRITRDSNDYVQSVCPDSHQRPGMMTTKSSNSD
jgi:hypothetical protein